MLVVTSPTLFTPLPPTGTLSINDSQLCVCGSYIVDVEKQNAAYSVLPLISTPHPHPHPHPVGSRNSEPQSHLTLEQELNSLTDSSVLQMPAVGVHRRGGN